MGRKDEGLALMRAAADAEDVTGPAAIFWRPDQVASGSYMVKATFALASCRHIRKRNLDVQIEGFSVQK